VAATSVAPQAGCRPSGQGCLTAEKPWPDVVTWVMDRKGPLKGKGGALAQWHREAAHRLTALHRAMEALAQSTREVQGRRWSLHVHRLRPQALQVRWREVSPARPHTLWERIEPQLMQLAPGLAQWYRETQELAQLLNHQEQVARYELKTVARLLGRRCRTTTGSVLGDGHSDDSGNGRVDGGRGDSSPGQRPYSTHGHPGP